VNKRLRWRKAAGSVIRAAFIVAALVVVLFPYLWVLASSLKGPAQLSRPKDLLFKPVLDNWTSVLTAEIPQNFLNSLTVGLSTVFISLLVATPAAYSIGKHRAGGRAMRFGILTSELMPPVVLVVPLFLIAFTLGVNDSLPAVVASHLTFVMPVITWFLIGFFQAVPKELEEQALIDGYGRFAAFRKVVLPQVLPGMAAASIFGFVLSWNDLFFALILAGGQAKTLPVAIAGYNTFRGVELGEMSVARLAAVVPVLVLSFFVQRRLVRGIAGGGMKY
jgi:ABC-type glycerol-3-phosphate transport system permease component